MNAGVAAWFADVPEESIYLSVLTIGEIRHGIQALRRRDPLQAAALDRWISSLVRQHADRILPVELQVAEEWGGLISMRTASPIDAMMAATARVNNLILVTRNVRHVSWTGQTVRLTADVLWMSQNWGVKPVIPDPAFEWKAVRASGPGGQNVNKVASKVELRVDLSRVPGLDDAARARLNALAASRMDADGHLLITSQLTRDQGRNLADAKAKALDLVAQAAIVPKKRRPTRPSRAAKARRLDAKKIDARRKANRGRPGHDD